MNPLPMYWFHCTVHTYGSWLHGDPRGFRTRHHREHIEGDYKNPPPEGQHEQQYQRSTHLLKQDPVHLEPQMREVVGRAFHGQLVKAGAEVLCISMSSTHAHVLAKMPDKPHTRNWIGQAKTCATFTVKRMGWEGELWGLRSKIDRIRDRTHQLNTYRYILGHVREGAWIWDFRRPMDSLESLT